MSDKNSKKSDPVTLEDYIPSEPVPKPPRRSRGRVDLSEQERGKLTALEKSLDGDDPKPKKKKKGGFWTMVFWIGLLILFAVWFD